MLRRPGVVPPPGPTIVVPANHFSATTLFDKEIVTSRPSRGLEQFFTYIRGQVGLSILDLAGASQENINFITNLGHRLYSEDFVRSLDDTFGSEDHTNASRIEQFLRNTMSFEKEQFDGVLVW